MKLLSFTILMSFSLSSYAVEFNSCTDDKGHTHFTNLPKSSLDSNCAPKNHYTVMLNQDYLNLSNEYAKYENFIEKEDSSNSEPFELSKVDISPDRIKNKVKDILDPDKALEELIDATDDRDDAFTNAMRGRSKGIETIMEQGKSGTP